MLRIKDWTVDLIYAVRGAARMYLVHKHPKHYLEFVKENKVPVIIIPGVLGRWAFAKPLADKISLEGHPVYIVPKLGNNLKDIPTSAKLVRELIDENNLKNVVLIAHSKGGFVGKYILKHLNSDERVVRMISVATPYSGSSLAKIFHYPRFREFSPESKMIKEISSYSDINHKVISINPSFDNIVWHEKGAYLKGAKNINVKIGGHNRVLNDKEVINIILRELSKNSP